MCRQGLQQMRNWTQNPTVPYGCAADMILAIAEWCHLFFFLLVPSQSTWLIGAVM